MSLPLGYPPDLDFQAPEPRERRYKAQARANTEAKDLAMALAGRLPPMSWTALEAVAREMIRARAT